MKTSEEGLPPANEFSIAFNTEDMPGKVKVTKITITEEIVELAVFEKTHYRLDLVHHPLFPRLARHVISAIRR